MGLLDRIMSFLGRTDSSETERSGDVSVTVERDPRADVDAESESAVKEPVGDEPQSDDAGSESPDRSAETASSGEAEEPIATDAPTAESEASESTSEPASATESASASESASDAPAGSNSDTEADSGAGTGADSGADTEDAPETTSEAGADTEDAPETTSEAGADLQTVKGIGPAYAERLEAAGVGSAEELAESDPESVAERIDVSEKQTGRWVERAKELE